MKHRSAESILTFALWCAFQINAHGQASSFTYQGSLNDGASPASGLYDFQFALFDASANGNEVGPLLQSTETVSGGGFTAVLDFGNVFNGSETWLEIGVKTNGSVGSYVTLSPRQLLTSVPYASFAITAGTLSGGLGSGMLAGGYTNMVSFSNPSNVFVGQMIGNGSSLSNLTVSAGNLTGTLGSGAFAGPYSRRVTISNAGNIFVGQMIGDGSGLTNLTVTASDLSGTVPSGGLSGEYPNQVNFSNPLNVFVGQMIGDGSGLSGLTVSASDLTGTLSSGALGGLYKSSLTFSNVGDVFVGQMIGDGSGLTNLSVAASNLSGAISSGGLLGSYPNAVSLSNPLNVFAGDGSGLVNLTMPAGNLTGTISSGALNGQYANKLTFSNPLNTFTGQMIGDGSGLSNLTVSASDLSGTLANNSLAGSYTNEVIFSNWANVFVGRMIGDGSGLTNLAVSGTNLSGNYADAVSFSNPLNLFVGQMVGDGSGLTNVTATLPVGVLTNGNAGTATFQGPVTLSGGMAQNGNTVLLATNTSEGSYTFVGSNINALVLANMANGVLTNAVAIGSGRLGPQIILPGIQGDTKMVRIWGREGNTIGDGGVVFESVKTNTATYLDVMPASISTSAMSSLGEAAWVDVVDRDLSLPGTDGNWETMNIGISGQGFAAPHGTVGTHAAGSGTVRDLWINGGNIEFFNGYTTPTRIGQLFTTATGSGFALCDKIASNAVAQQFAGTVVLPAASASTPTTITQLQFPTNSTIEYEYHFVAIVASNPPTTYYHTTYSGTVALSQSVTNAYTVDGVFTNMLTGNTAWVIAPTTSGTGVIWTFLGDGTNSVQVKYNIFASGGGQARTYTY